MKFLKRYTFLILGMLCLIVAGVMATSSDADAKPSHRAQGEYMLWRWVDCAAGAENVAEEIINLDSVGYRYQVMTWVWEEGVLDRTVTQRPWVLPATHNSSGYHGEITTTPLDNDDTTVRTKVTRVHQNALGNWVTDDNLMDVTTDGCDRLHPAKPTRTIKVSSGPR